MTKDYFLNFIKTGFLFTVVMMFLLRVNVAFAVPPAGNICVLFPELCGLVNQPPLTPTGQISSPYVQNTGIQFYTTDPDGDNIAYTYSIDNTLYNLSGSSAASGAWTSYNYAHGNLNFGQLYTVYIKADDGKGGVSYGSFTFILTNPTPAADLAATPNTIPLGQSSTLTWTSSNAVSCSIDQGIGNVALSGTKIVSPASTTVYTLTCTGSTGQSAGDNETVTVLTEGNVSVVVNRPTGIPDTEGGFKLYFGTSEIATSTVSQTYSNQPVGDYRIEAIPISSFNASVSPSDTQTLIGGESIIFTIDYTYAPSAASLSISPTVTRAGGTAPGVTVEEKTNNNWEIKGSVRVGDRVDINSVMKDDWGNTMTGTYSWTLKNLDTGATSAISSSSSATWVPDESGTFEITLDANGFSRKVTIRVPKIETLVPQ